MAGEPLLITDDDIRQAASQNKIRVSDANRPQESTPSSGAPLVVVLDSDSPFSQAPSSPRRGEQIGPHASQTPPVMPARRTDANLVITESDLAPELGDRLVITIDDTDPHPPPSAAQPVVTITDDDLDTQPIRVQTAQPTTGGSSADAGTAAQINIQQLENDSTIQHALNHPVTQQEMEAVIARLNQLVTPMGQLGLANQIGLVAQILSGREYQTIGDLLHDVRRLSHMSEVELQQALIDGLVDTRQNAIIATPQNRPATVAAESQALPAPLTEAVQTFQNASRSGSGGDPLTGLISDITDSGYAGDVGHLSTGELIIELRAIRAAVNRGDVEQARSVANTLPDSLQSIVGSYVEGLQTATGAQNTRSRTSSPEPSDSESPDTGAFDTARQSRLLGSTGQQSLSQHVLDPRSTSVTAPPAPSRQAHPTGSDARPTDAAPDTSGPTSPLESEAEFSTLAEADDLEIPDFLRQPSDQQHGRRESESLIGTGLGITPEFATLIERGTQNHFVNGDYVLALLAEEPFMQVDGPLAQNQIVSKNLRIIREQLELLYENILSQSGGYEAEVDHTDRLSYKIDLERTIASLPATHQPIMQNIYDLFDPKNENSFYQKQLAGGEIYPYIPATEDIGNMQPTLTSALRNPDTQIPPQAVFEFMNSFQESFQEGEMFSTEQRMQRASNYAVLHAMVEKDFPQFNDNNYQVRRQAVARARARCKTLTYPPRDINQITQALINRLDAQIYIFEYLVEDDQEENIVYNVFYTANYGSEFNAEGHISPDRAVDMLRPLHDLMERKKNKRIPKLYPDDFGDNIQRLQEIIEMIEDRDYEQARRSAESFTIADLREYLQRFIDRLEPKGIQDTWKAFWGGDPNVSPSGFPQAFRNSMQNRKNRRK